MEPFTRLIVNASDNCNLAMGGLSGTKSDDFINAAKARAEAAIQEIQPKLTKLEKAFRHAALRRRAQNARKAADDHRAKPKS